MPDARFYDSLGPISLADLARRTGAAAPDAAAGSIALEQVAPVARANASSVSFLADRRYLADLRITKAAACFVTAQLAGEAPPGCVPLIVAAPQAAYVTAAMLLHRPKVFIPEGGLIHSSAELEEDVSLGAGVVIGPGARIGRGTIIGSYAVIGPGVAIGRDCAIGPHASIGFALLGDRVKVFSGARIGEAGFGVAPGPAGLIDVPQLGRAIIQDGVTIGAGSCIDRGAWDDTVVGEDSKLDNLVHIGHNTQIGRRCLFAAYTGISGSVTIGDGVAFGGRAGVADHVVIGAGASIAAAAGVMKDVPPGEVWGGSPARPLRRWMRETAWIAKMAHARPGEKGGGS